MRERERIHGTTKKPFSTYTYRPQKTLRNCIRSKFLIQLRYDCSNGSTHRTYTKSNSATPSYGIHLFQTFTKAQSKQINIFPTHMLYTGRDKIRTHRIDILLPPFVSLAEVMLCFRTLVLLAVIGLFSLYRFIYASSTLVTP